MAFTGDLTTFNKIYPLYVDKFESLIPIENMSVTDKINSVIQHLNRVGKLSNDAIKDWNAVMKWLMEDGLGESVNEKVDQLIADGKFDELLQGMNDEINANVDTKLTGFETSLTDNTKLIKNPWVDVTDKQFGAKGDGVTDDTLSIQSAINYCITNKKDLFFPSGTYKTTSEILITGFIRIYGTGKNSVIQSNGTNLNILTVQFSSPTTSDYSFSNLEISDITIVGSTLATVQNAICFNSVIVIYNKLKNLRINEVKGSAIRLIHDGIRSNKSFYSHNVYWTGIYLSNTSEFLTQETINSGTTPWVYGGEISDCHIEGTSSLRSKPYLFDLTGFHNMNIKDVITEGNINTSFTSVYKCTDNAIFTNTYFEFILQNASTIGSYFELSGGRFKIHNPVNLGKSCVKTTTTNTIVEVEGGTYNSLNTLNHTSSVGKLIVKKPSFGSWFSGLSQDDVIPYSNQGVTITDADVGSYTFSKNDNVEIYRLDKGAYISNSFGDSVVSRFNSGTMPTMSIYEDPIYGRCIKFVPVDANNGVFAGVQLALGTNYIGKNVTIIARFKWQSTNLQITNPNLIGSYQNILMDNNTLVNDTWRVSSQLAKVDGSGNVYVRFDYNNSQTYTAPQNLYVSEIIVAWGSTIPTLPLKDDRLITMYGTTPPTTGTFIKGDKVVNTTSGGVEGWVCITGGSPGTWQGYGFINSSSGTVLDVSGTKSVYINDTTNDGQLRIVNTSTGNYIQSGRMDGTTVKDLYLSGINASPMASLQVKANTTYFSGAVSESGLLLSSKYAPIMVTPPASATASGTTGQMAQDGSYLYICIATNTWKRVAIATW